MTWKVITSKEPSSRRSGRISDYVFSFFIDEWHNPLKNDKIPLTFIEHKFYYPEKQAVRRNVF